MLIYRYLTKKDREEAKLKKYLLELEQERERQTQSQSTPQNKSNQNSAPFEEDLTSQIEKYEKVRKSFKKW